MTTLWRKASRDLWLEPTRAILVALAVALGIAGFTAVLSSYAILTRELNNGYLASDPPSASLQTDRVDDSLIRAVAADPRVSAVEPRRILTGSIRTGPAQWRPLVLFVVDPVANRRIGKIRSQSGHWPPAPGEVSLERDALGVARAGVGANIQVRFARSLPRVLRVAGTVHDVGQAQARMENLVYAYATPATVAAMGEEPFFDRLDILVADHRLDEPHIRRVAADAARTMKRQGHPVTGLEVPTPGKHPHAAIMGMLLLAMAAFGLGGLVLSGALVINFVSALMASQIRQVGVLRAVGGTRRQIAGIYLGQAALLGTSSLAIGLVCGLLGGRALCRSMAAFLNFDITSFAVPPRVWVVVVLAGYGIPILAAAAPVFRATRVRPAEAMNDYGVGRSHFGSSALDRAAVLLRGAAAPILLACRGGLRRPARLAITIGTLSAGGVFFLSALNVRDSLARAIDRIFAQRRFDLAVTLPSLSPLPKIERSVGKIAEIAEIEGWIITEAARSPSSGTEARPARAAATDADHDSENGLEERFALVALPVPTRALALDILRGRNLASGDRDALVINTALEARSRDWRVGQRVRVTVGGAPSSWQIVGVAREPFSPPAAYATRSYFDARGQSGTVNALRLRLTGADADSIARARASLEKNLLGAGILIRGTASTSESRFGLDQHMLMINVFLIIASAVIGGVGALGLATTMSLAGVERRREIGILRAIGATPAAIVSLLVVESLAISLASWVIAAAAAWPISAAIGRLLAQMLFSGALTTRLSPIGLFTWLAVSTAVAGAAGALAARSAVRPGAPETLSYE